MPQPTDKVPTEVEARLEEIKLRLKRASSNGLSREMDFLWVIRQLTDLTELLFTEVYKQKEIRYGKAPKHR